MHAARNGYVRMLLVHYLLHTKMLALLLVEARTGWLRTARVEWSINMVRVQLAHETRKEWVLQDV